MDRPIEQINTRPAPIVTQLNETLALSIQKQLNRAERGRAVDIRQPSSALLTINSADRYKPTNSRWNTPDLSGVILSSPYDFVIPLQQNIMSGFFTRIALTSLQLPFTVPSICGKTHGIFIWFQPGGSGAVTRYLVQVSLNTFGGYKDLAALLTALQSRVRAVTGSTTFTWAVNGTNGALASSANTDKFYFTRWDNPDVPGAATYFELLNIQANHILSTTQFSYPEIIPTQYLDIVCDQLTQAQTLKDASTGGSGKTLLKRIYLFGDNTTTLLTAPTAFFTGPVVIQKSYAVPKYISWNSEQNIGALRIQVLDDRGVVLTCGPNNGPFSPSATNEAGHMWLDENMSDWSMEIMLSEL
jgi:hypothetical protein